MIDNKLVDNIKNLTLDECKEELDLIIQFFPNKFGKDWFEIYNRLINDRRAYRILDMEDKYNGQKDGSLDPLLDARMKILSYEVWKTRVTE